MDDGLSLSVQWMDHTSSNLRRVDMAKAPVTGSPDTLAQGQTGPQYFDHSKLIPTDGWYVALGCTAGILSANTRFGKLIFGVLTVALLYQVSQWIQGK
jgi:hypothetical protein